jgi:large subunit ribosomal protein L24
MKPNKSRKKDAEKGLHQVGKSIAGHLNEKLKKELGKRSLALRKKDTVKILRGEFKGKSGQITKIDRKDRRIEIEKVIRKKSDGTEYNVKIDPSNVVVIAIENNDKRRLKRGKNEQ